MKTRAVILAGGEGARLGTLTAKRTKPAVPFAGKYRMIDFPLSNCVNSGIYDVMILAQYRPHSLIEHIGAGGPWDLNRDFTGGVRILTPYKARGSSEWYLGTADAVQQNYRFIKHNNPDLVLILSGDHIYRMNYESMISYHLEQRAEVTMGVIRVPMEEAHRFGILEIDERQRVTSFVEKPAHPTSNLINMGVYLFNLPILNQALLEDHQRSDSTHDFGKDILPRLVKARVGVYALLFLDYWMDVGTVESYWRAHMDLLVDPPPIDLNDRSWIIHTRTEERPPVRLARGTEVIDSMITDGCVLSPKSLVERSVIGPGVTILPGAQVRESVILTDTVIGPQARIERAIIDKRVTIGAGTRLGGHSGEADLRICMVGKNSEVPPNITIEPGAIIATDVLPEDYDNPIVHSDDYIQKKRSTYEA
jgi:glucose-1-phosphate adenylyltransferase